MDANQEFKNNFNKSNQDKFENKELIPDELSSNILDTINIIIQESFFYLGRIEKIFLMKKKEKIFK